MSLYPSLEDMQVDKLIQAQQTGFGAAASDMPKCNNPSAPINGEILHSIYPSSTQKPVTNVSEVYPGLTDFMGLELSQDIISANMPEYLCNHQVTLSASRDITATGLVAPLSGNTVGLLRGHVTNGIRELVLCKGADKKVGLRVRDINKGVFVSIVVKDSPAALAGLRFGDQILQINGTTVAGFSIDDIHKLLRKSHVNNISVIVRDRPFERAITLHKDSLGRVGFQFNNGKITTIVKDSSAAKNGLLIEHQLLEINGQNVVGMKDKQITALIDNGGQIVTITVMPTFVYEHMMKKLSLSFVRGIMDHSTPDF